jgi:hypothetical protein
MYSYNKLVYYFAMNIKSLCYKNYYIELYFYHEWRWRAYNLDTDLGVECGLINLKSKYHAWKHCKKIIDSMER